MGPRLFTIEREGQGRLSTMAAPQGKDHLLQEMQALRLSRVDTVVSMLTMADSRKYGLENEGTAAGRVGIRFISLPTRDFDMPEPTSIIQVARDLVNDLAADRGVAIHCRAGIGRSSMLAAVVLSLEGIAPDDAWQRISRARGFRVPDTEDQRRFVDDLIAQTVWTVRSDPPR